MKAILTALLLFMPLAAPAAVAFTKIADTTTPAPGGTGAFRSFASINAQSGRIAFMATEPTETGTQLGVFMWEGGALRRLFDQTAIVPNASGSFTNMHSLVMKGNLIVIGGGEVGRNGIYRFENGALNKWVDTTHDLPNGQGILSFIGFAIDEDQLVFAATAPNYRAALLAQPDGELTLLWDKYAMNPGALSMDRDTAFAWISSASAGGPALVAASNSTPRVVYSAMQTRLPPRSTLFGGFRNPPRAIDGKVVSFISYSGGGGIYIINQDGSGLERLVDTAMTAPSGSLFTSFTDFTYSAGTLVFSSATGGATRMFRLQNGAIDLLLSPGDIVDGMKIVSVGPTLFGLHEGLLAFPVTFEGGVAAVYSADVGVVRPPEIKFEPSSAQYANGRFTFNFSGVPGKTYRIEHSTTIPFTAQSVTTLTTITFSAPVTIVDENAGGAARYYRAVEQ